MVFLERKSQAGCCGRGAAAEISAARHRSGAFSERGWNIATLLIGRKVIVLMTCTHGETRVRNASYKTFREYQFAVDDSRPGIPDRRIYDLRDSFALRANACRASGLTIAQLLGHANNTQILPTVRKASR